MYSLLLLVVISGWLWYAITKRLSYWKRNGVQQYSLTKIFKDDFEAFTKSEPIGVVFQEHCKAFSGHRYFGLYNFFKKSLVVLDVDILKQITVKDFDHFVDHGIVRTGNDAFWDKGLFTLEGKAWKDMRIALNPTFTTHKIKMMFDLVSHCIDQFMNHLEEQLVDQTCVSLEFEDAYNRLASDVIASVAFGYSDNSLKNRDNEFYENAQLALYTHSAAGSFNFFLLVFLPKIARLFGIRFFPKAVGEFFFRLIDDNIKKRGKYNIVRHDIVHLLMEAKSQALRNGTDFTNVDITAQALFMYFAGVDTISVILTFASYELAVHNQIQKRLQNEIDAVLEECGGNVIYETLHQLKYMDMVLSETLRKWPPSMVTDRTCTKPYVIQPKNPGEMPIYLKKGDFIWIPMHYIQRDPKLFPNPEEFDPERFSDENKSNINPYAYMPFGLGPRSCIGRRFALLEMKLLLFKMLSRFSIVPVDKTVVPLKLAKVSKHLTMEGGLWLGLKRRNPTAS